MRVSQPALAPQLGLACARLARAARQLPQSLRERRHVDVDHRSLFAARAMDGNSVNFFS
jgi:hypothetical protein